MGDWSQADFEMHRNNPSISFSAADQRHNLFDIKLRLSIGLFGSWRVDEVAYYCSAEPEPDPGVIGENSTT